MIRRNCALAFVVATVALATTATEAEARHCRNHARSSGCCQNSGYGTGRAGFQGGLFGGFGNRGYGNSYYGNSGYGYQQTGYFQAGYQQPGYYQTNDNSYQQPMTNGYPQNAAYNTNGCCNVQPVCCTGQPSGGTLAAPDNTQVPAPTPPPVAEAAPAPGV